MTEHTFGVGSHVSICRADIVGSNIARIMDTDLGKDQEYGQVIADVKNTYNMDIKPLYGDLKLVMFDAGATWGYDFLGLGPDYQDLIRKSPYASQTDYLHRKYSGIFSKMLKDGPRLNNRVSTTVEKLQSSSVFEPAGLLMNVDSKTVLYGTVVDYPSLHRSCTVIMFDESDKYGYLLQDMGEAVQAIVKKLNIPNVHKRRFICACSTDLHFHTDSITRTKENTMSNKIVETLKGDAKEAAYRVAGTQITNGVKLGVVKLFESKGGKSEHMVMLKEVLDSEVGDSLIALLLGYGLNYAPGLKDDPRIQKLSEEFRINGMAVAGRYGKFPSGSDRCAFGTSSRGDQ